MSVSPLDYSDQTISASAAFAGFDLIGDVHGCGDSLVELLQKLGYQKHDGAYQYSNQRHPEVQRTAHEDPLPKD